ncbi:hypothetical protein C0995_016501 [Termitomyces sp. Mi166|nr:hypothetical protein C0995_016501 [Termitomyces sp. Mi166\
MGPWVQTAAGNENMDANEFSPARAPAGITVGATDIDDKRASFSNYGPQVDVYAPGNNIKSTYIGGDEVSPPAETVRYFSKPDIIWQGDQIPFWHFHASGRVNRLVHIRL